MPEDGCNPYQPNVHDEVICSCLEQLTNWAAHTTCKNQVREQMTFSFYFATRWRDMCVMNKHHQSATRWVQPVQAKSTQCINLFLFGATYTLGSTD